MLGAEVEHLLGLGDAADQRAGEARRPRIKLGTPGDGCGFGGTPTRTSVPSRLERRQVGVEVVAARRRCR